MNKKIEIIYPHYNGTASWWKTNRYDIKIGNTTHYIYDYNVIRLFEVMIKENLINAQNMKKVVSK